MSIRVFIAVSLGACAALFVAVWVSSPMTGAEETAAPRPSEAANALSTSTPTLAWPTSTATPTATPTLPPERQPMHVFVRAWIDANPGFSSVTALIADTECATVEPIIVPGDYAPSITVEIPAAAVRPGCGTPGAVVRFIVDGREARPTITWSPGEYVSLTLFVGPDFARYYGRYVLPQPPGLWTIVPTIGAMDCGYQLNPLLGEGPEWAYDVVVYPHEIRAGCGRLGGLVRFEVRAGDDVLAVAQETAIWEPGAVKELPLTMIPVVPRRALPITGDGSGAAGGLAASAAIAMTLWGAMLVTAGLSIRDEK
jgi:hypothetical protein